MSPFTVDGILYVPPAQEEEPEKPSDEFWSGGELSTAVVVAGIFGLAAGSILATTADRAVRALPALLDRLALLPYLPGLIWHSARLVLSEPTEQRRGERR